MTAGRLDRQEAQSSRQQALLFALGRVAAGDRDALQEVYRLTSVKLFAVCLRILHERADAEEALQDTYVSVWHNALRFDPTQASPVTWLAAIARNRSIDKQRAGRRPSAVPVEAAGDVIDPGADAIAGLEAVESEAQIAACLEGLAPDEISLIRTAFYEDVGYPELARRAGQPLGTVKSRIRRALLKLRACLS